MQKEFRSGQVQVIRISGNIRHDLQFIKGFVGIASNVPNDEVIEVIEVLIKMFKQKKIGQLIDGKTRYLWIVTF